jgi:tetratricopeptide (TPR) repeat protein
MMLRTRANGLRFLGALAIFSSTLMQVHPALAQDDATIQMARERFKEGVQYFDQKQYDKARAAFLQAYALKKHPAVLLNLAQSELRSGHEADAAKHFSQYLREEKNPTPAEKQAADSGLQASKAATLEVTIQADADDADVFVDGNQEGKTPLPGPVYLMPGPHTIELRKGDRTVTERVNGVAGQNAIVSLTLRAKPKPAAEAAPRPSENEQETAQEEPDTEDDTPAEPAPASGQRMSFPRYLFTTPPGLVGLGLTAVGIGGGIGFALASKSNYDAADSVARKIEAQAEDDSKGSRASNGVCKDPETWLAQANFTGDRDVRATEYRGACSKFQNNVDNGDTMKTLSIVSWAVAGTAAVGTVVYYFVKSPKESTTSSGKPFQLKATLVPVLSPHERGVSIVGEF